jgi:hypothetical protein
LFLAVSGRGWWFWYSFAAGTVCISFFMSMRVSLIGQVWRVLMMYNTADYGVSGHILWLMTSTE